MSKHPLHGFRQALCGTSRKSNKRTHTGDRSRNLGIETLESRQMLSITPLSTLDASGGTGEKPQSKVFQYANQWWTVMPNSSGTWIFRLDGTDWTAIVIGALQLV